MGRVVLGSQEGVPNPCLTAVLALGMADLCVLDSRCIHQDNGRGGSMPTSSLVMPALLPLWPWARTG